MTRTLKTIDYGTIQIASKETWLCDEIINLVEDCNGKDYEIRKTLNGQIVALELI